MSKQTIDTGSEWIDGLLRELFDICSSKKRLQEIKAAIDDDSLSTHEFFRVVPESLLPLVLLLRSPTQYKGLLKEVKNDSLPLIEEAKRLVNEHFRGIISHSASLSKMESTTVEHEEETSEEEQTPREDHLKRIAAIDYAPMWSGKPPKLQPVVRLFLMDVGRNLLLDTTLEWDRSLFVVDGIVKIVADEMEAGTGLNGQLAPMEKAEFSQIIRQLEVNLDRIRDLAPHYGIDLLEAPSASESD